MRILTFLFLLSGPVFGSDRKAKNEPSFGNQLPVSVHTVNVRQIESPYNRSEPIEQVEESDFEGTLFLPSVLPSKPFAAKLSYRDDNEDFNYLQITLKDPRAMAVYLDFLRLENSPWMLEMESGAFVRVLPNRFKVRVLPNGDAKLYVTVKTLELPNKDRKSLTLRHPLLDIPLSQFANEIQREPEAFYSVGPEMVFRVNHEDNHLYQVLVLGYEPISTAGAPHDLSDYMRGNENENGYLAHAVLKEHFDDAGLTQIPIYRLPIGLLGKGPIRSAPVKPSASELMRGLSAFRSYGLDIDAAKGDTRWEKLVRTAHATHPTQLIAEVLLRRHCAAIIAQRSSRSAIDPVDKSP